MGSTALTIVELDCLSGGILHPGAIVMLDYRQIAFAHLGRPRDQNPPFPLGLSVENHLHNTSKPRRSPR